MANVLGGDGGVGLPLEAWFYEMPIVTRTWTTSTVLAGILVQCKILTPFQLFYSHRTVFNRGQYWRLLSTFIYVSPLSLSLVFHVFFIQRYARMLEEGAPSSGHFLWLLLFACTSLLIIAPMFGQLYLGHALSSTLTYIWSRRNPNLQLSILGVTFKAPWLPWIMLAFQLVLTGHLPKDDLCGIAVGHVYYFLNDIFPASHGGYRPLDPPRLWVRLFERDRAAEPERDVPVVQPVREAAPVEAR